MYRSRLLLAFPLAALLAFSCGALSQSAGPVSPPERQGFAGEASRAQDSQESQANPVGEYGELGRGRSALAASPLACPTGSIPNFYTPSTTCTTACDVKLAWSAPAGADSSTVYEVYRSIRGDYCTSNTPTLLGTVQGLAYNSNTVPLNSVQAYFVAVQGCSGITTPFTYIYDTFQTAPGTPSLAATVASNQVTLTYSQPDPKSYELDLYRAGATGNFSQVTPGSFQNYCPAGKVLTFVDSILAPGTYRYIAGNSGDFATLVNGVPNGVFSNIATVTVGSVCTAPGPSVLTSSVTSITAGQSFLVKWSAASGFLPGSTYEVQTSPDAFSPTIDATFRTSDTSLIIPTAVSGTSSRVSVRVRAVQACGTPGPFSNVAIISVTAAQSDFSLTKVGPSWTIGKNDPAPVSAVTVRNVGGVPGRITFSLGSGGLSFGFSPAFLDVDPGAEGTVTLTGPPGSQASVGVFAGLLVGTYGNKKLSTPVTLTVTPNSIAAGSLAGTRTKSSNSLVVFSAPSGSNPSPQSITVTVGPIGATPVFLKPTIGPGGSWLTIFSVGLSSAVPSNGQVTISLGVDRSKRTVRDGASPIRTLLQIGAIGSNPADAAVIEIVDVDTIPIAGGAGLRTAVPQGGTSFIIPTSVRANGQGGAFFASDGWLKNLGASSVSADLFYTPQGRDGNTDPSVQKCALTIPAGGTLRLSDFLSSYFSTSGTGQIELRSTSIGALSLRTTVESITGGDPTTKYGTEIPTVAYGSGVGAGGGALAVPGIDDDVLRRANLILAETVGSNATALVTIYNSGGGVVGTKAYTLPAYGKIQVDRVVNDVSPGATLSGGWLSVSVTAGAGRVIPIATVIDNKSNSFSAILGQGPSVPASGSAPGPQPLAGLPQKFIVPAAVRARGAFTQFVTDLKVVNPTGTPAALTLTYNYIDLEDGNVVKTAVRPVTIPARGTLSSALSNDVIVSLFGVTNQSKGSITFEGSVAQVAASAAISAQVDPSDPSKGVKTAQINRAFLDSPDILAPGSPEHRFAGCEKSIQKRTSLILLEVDGGTCAIKVKGSTSTGETLAERTYTVTGGQYFQIVDLFGGDGLNLGDGPFQNVEVSVQALSGTGRVIALSTVNDNISQNPEIFILQQPGSTGPSIGF